MHGVIFATLDEYLREEHGTALPRTYDTAAAYADEEFAARLAEAADAVGVSAAEIERGLGRYAGRVGFARLFPDYYARSSGTRQFLLGVEEKIHEVVRATIPQAAPPRLTVTPLGRDSVVVSYTSRRGLCALLQGVIEGTAEYYGETFALTQPTCMHHGDAACSVVVEAA